MRKSKEFMDLAAKMKTMQPAVICGYLKAVYKEGYKDGHAACCDELGLEDGDHVVIVDEDMISEKFDDYIKVKK